MISCTGVTGYGSLTTRLEVATLSELANSSASSQVGKAGACVPMSPLKTKTTKDVTGKPMARSKLSQPSSFFLRRRVTFVKLKGQRSTTSLPLGNQLPGHMNSIDGLKTCRKGLHQYEKNLKRCPECRKNFYRERYKKNRKQIRNRQFEYYENNKEKLLEQKRQYRKQNLEKSREYDRNRYAENRDKKLNLMRKWRQKNPDKMASNNAKHKAQKKKALAPWANLNDIKKIYAAANRLTKETGINHEVDHIFPLNSDYMCGLHVETNLQILTEKENIKKGNRTWPGQLECQRLPLHLNGFSQEIVD